MTAEINDRPPNFRDNSGRLFLVRCFSCGGEAGRENYAPMVASGGCAFCGWSYSLASLTGTPDGDGDC